MKRAALAVLLLSGVASADQVYLAGGRKIDGVVVEQTATRVVLDVGAGRVTLPMSRVERVVGGPTALAAYRARAAALAPRDVRGWSDLAAWAEEHGLSTQSREAWDQVLAADPDNAAAHGARGDVRVGDTWMTEDQAYRARGFVRFEGSWVTPEERRMMIAARADEAAADAARAEASSRAREAEARARIAEADARAAEASADAAAASASQVDSGIPLYGGVYGGVYGGAYGGGVYGPYGGGAYGGRVYGGGINGGSVSRPSRPPGGGSGGGRPGRPPGPVGPPVHPGSSGPEPTPHAASVGFMPRH